MAYLPRRDADALDWFELFVKRLLERPAVYGQTPAQVAVMADAVGRFRSAYALSGNPDTRTKLNTSVKDKARDAATAACRLAYMHIKLDPSLTSADRLAAGVPEPVTRGRRVGVPTTCPTITPGGPMFNAHALVWRDGSSADARKPRGVTQVQIYRALAPDRESAEALDGLEYLASFSRTRTVFGYDIRQNGMWAAYVGRWVTGTGLVGKFGPPLVQPVSATALPFDAIPRLERCSEVSRGRFGSVREAGSPTPRVA